MGKGSAGARLRGMGRGNDAKTALSHKKIQVKMIENHGQGRYNGKFEGYGQGQCRDKVVGHGQGQCWGKVEGHGQEQ